MEIRIDDLRGPEIAALLEAHLDLMRSQSPPESVHALDLDKLRQSDVTFWTAWNQSSLLGCVALKQHDPVHGEIKSMHTTKTARGNGIGTKMLAHLENQALSRNYRRLSLETGSQDAFLPARMLYTAAGYEVCGPFADYKEDPNSTFMTKAL